MNDSTQATPNEDSRPENHTVTLSPNLIDRITLIHHAFRNYLSATLDETVNNFAYDENPEQEIRIWEHMASTVLALKYQYEWPDEKVMSAVKVVLGFSMGALQQNDLDEVSMQQIVKIWNERNSDHKRNL